MDLRKRLKSELTRRLYSQGRGREDIVRLYGLIDPLLRLPEALEVRFQRELARFEEDMHIPYVTSIERIGRKEGRREGLREGQFKTAALLLRLVGKRFPALGAGDEAAIRALSFSQLESLGEALLDFESIEDLRKWVGRKET